VLGDNKLYSLKSYFDSVNNSSISGFIFDDPNSNNYLNFHLDLKEVGSDKNNGNGGETSSSRLSAYKINFETYEDKKNNTNISHAHVVSEEESLYFSGLEDGIYYISKK